MSRKGQGHEMTMNQSHQTWYGTSSETHDHKLFCCQTMEGHTDLQIKIGF